MNRLKDYFTKKRLIKLERDLKMLKDRYNFDAWQAIDLSSVLGRDAFTKKIQEYQVWNTGNSRVIRNFYSNYNLEQSYFWQEAPNNYIKRHCGIPKLISNKMGTIIFGSGFKPDVTVYKMENGKVAEDKDEQATKDAQDVLNSLFEKTKLLKQLHSQAVKESWCGESFLKFNYDLTLSQFPIIKAYDLTNAEAVVEKGITTSIIFHSWYYKKKNERDLPKKYRYDEEYTTNDGYAIIYNRLYELQVDGKIKEVSLDTIEETRGIEPVYDFNRQIKGMLAFHKPNKLPNNEFPDCPYGASDYQGAIDSFDGLDEVYSEFVAETRNNKTIRYIPADMIPVDENGIPLLNLAKWITNYEKVVGDQDQGTNSEIQIQQIPDKTASLAEKYLKYLTNSINLAGLSPLALGVTGLEAINSGESSQKERNRVTLETRKDKINNYWQPFLKEVILQLLNFNNWLVNFAGAKQEGLDVNKVSFENADITFDFGNYVVESEDNIITRWANAKMSGLSSIENGIRQIHPDWTDEQVTEEVTKIKFENNIGVDDPTLLQMDLTEEDIFTNGEDTE